MLFSISQSHRSPVSSLNQFIVTFEARRDDSLESQRGSITALRSYVCNFSLIHTSFLIFHNQKELYIIRFVLTLQYSNIARDKGCLSQLLGFRS